MVFYFLFHNFYINFFFVFLPSLICFPSFHSSFPFPLPLLFLSCHADLNQDADLRCQSDASRVCVCVFARMNKHSMCVCMLAVNHASSEPRYPQSRGISGATQSPSVLRVTAHVPPQTDFSRFLKPEKLLSELRRWFSSRHSEFRASHQHSNAALHTGLQMRSVWRLKPNKKAA